MKWNNRLFTNYVHHIASHEHINNTVKQCISSSAAQMSRLAEADIHYTSCSLQTATVHQSVILTTPRTAYIYFYET